MASDGSDQVRLTAKAGEDAGPTYRSDGRIMFVSDRAGGSDIYTMAENGSDVAQVSSGAQVTSVPVMGTGSTTRAQVEYQYDALGRMRAMTTHQGALTQVLTYGYSGPTDSHSYVADGSGNIEFAVFSGPTGVLATASKNPSAFEISWYYFDHRGDTRAIADDSGQVTWSASYSAYGEVAQSTGGTPAFGFVGAHRRITNPLTGLIHMGARMYEPTLGRFLSRDPIMGGSANDYEYTSGDPVNRLDLSGMTHSCHAWYRKDQCNQQAEDDICQWVVDNGMMDAAQFYCHTVGGNGKGVRRVRGANGTVFVISTRTGQLMAVDLGSQYASRRVDWGDIGKSAGYQLPGGQILARYRDPQYSTSPSGTMRVIAWVGIRFTSDAFKSASWTVTAAAVIVGGVYSWSGQCSAGACSLW